MILPGSRFFEEEALKAGRYFSVAVCLLALLLFFSVSPAAAAKRTAREATIRQGPPDGTTMVEGHIEDVTSQAIRVRGKYYYFTGAAAGGAGQRWSNQLRRGSFVRLYFHDGALENIQVSNRRRVQ